MYVAEKTTTALLNYIVAMQLPQKLATWPHGTSAIPRRGAIRHTWQQSINHGLLSKALHMFYLLNVTVALQDDRDEADVGCVVANPEPC